MGSGVMAQLLAANVPFSILVNLVLFKLDCAIDVQVGTVQVGILVQPVQQGSSAMVHCRASLAVRLDVPLCAT